MGRLREALSTLKTSIGDLPTFPNSRRDGQFAHPLVGGLPKGQMAFAGTDLAPEDEPIAARVLAAWQRASSEEPRAASGDAYWDQLLTSNFGDLVRSLRTGDPSKAAKTLSQCFRHRMMFGIGPSDRTCRRARTRHGSRLMAAKTIDRLVSFSEAVGVLSCECPEQGRWGRNLYRDPEELASLLERALGLRVEPPAIAGYHGLKIGARILADRSVDHAYTAWRIREILRGRPRTVVAEIGGGFGGVAYFARGLGIPSYHVYDLPLVNAIQGYYLLKTLPGGAVLLFGESGGGESVSVLPWWRFRSAGERSFDLVLNQDSFPELPEETVREYLQEIRRRLSSHFLSINQEGEAPAGSRRNRQLLVPRLIQEIGGFVRLSRSRHWIRPGYVEELYSV